ncbi:MAG: hypothetical protein K2H37_10385 [Lachnospiraceae bacterium]|nr:hypothetical protein [Lachnospiraceae bacterium]
MIHIFPYMKFTIRSGKTPEEVNRIMETGTAVRDGFLQYSPDGTDFVGEVWESEFEVVPRLPLGFRDSFLPVITGHIQSWGSGAAVDIHMGLRADGLIFCVVLFGMTGLYFLVSLLSLIVGQPDGWKAAVSAVGFFLFGQLIVRGGFYIPARKAKRRLEELLGEAADTDGSVY